LLDLINASTGRNHTTSDKVSAAVRSGEFAYGAKLANSVKDESLLIQEAQRLGVPLWLAPRMIETLETGAKAGFLEKDSMFPIQYMGEMAGIDARSILEASASCHAPSRMLVHESQVESVLPFLVDETSKFRLGDPHDSRTTMGPVINQAQYETVQRYIQSGIDEGARLVCGGTGRPDGFDRGFFVQPTVFSGVTPSMTIATEEIFGPVLAVMPYSTESEALKIANDSIYGLGGYIFAGDRKRGYEFASGLRAGRICFNGAATNSLTPMGGYKQSGTGRSMGVFGLEEYLEIKSVYGFSEEAAAFPELIR
jgi:aldehyde dehydrogenase (NAD+)